MLMCEVTNKTKDINGTEGGLGSGKWSSCKRGLGQCSRHMQHTCTCFANTQNEVPPSHWSQDDLNNLYPIHRRHFLETHCWSQWEITEPKISSNHTSHFTYLHRASRNRLMHFCLKLGSRFLSNWIYVRSVISLHLVNAIWTKFMVNVMNITKCH